MRAKFINETQNFKREGSPLKKMNIGMTDERVLNKAVKDLKEVGLDALWRLEFGYSKGIYSFIINKMKELQIIYANDEAAKEEWGEEDGIKFGGWGIMDDRGTDFLGELTHDWNKVFKKIIRMNYGTKGYIQNNIDSLEEELKILKKVQKII